MVLAALTLHTRCLTLMSESYFIRSVTQQDLPIILSWRNHPDIRRFMFTRHEISATEHSEWFSSVINDKSRSLLLIEDSKHPFGYVQFSNIVENGTADWGFFVKPGAPKGSGLILGKLALRFAFNTLKVHKVCGKAIALNTSSINFHLKLGFIQEGTLREQILIDDTYQDIHCFGLILHDWINNPHLQETNYDKH